MADKPVRKVLIVDDEPEMAAVLKDCFRDRNDATSCPYRFDVDVAHSTAQCVDNSRATRYDVVVLDIRMERLSSGLQLCFSMQEEAGLESPVRIVVTGYPTYETCVNALRSGAWDYLIKQDSPKVPFGVRVVNSAIWRLRALDLRRDLERAVALEWLPAHLPELRPKYDGKLLAIWHEPDVGIVASGKDSFELEEQLQNWRERNPGWHQPFVVRIPGGFVDNQDA